MPPAISGYAAPNGGMLRHIAGRMSSASGLGRASVDSFSGPRFPGKPRSCTATARHFPPGHGLSRVTVPLALRSCDAQNGVLTQRFFEKSRVWSAKCFEFGFVESE